jgi:hypothetical protein
MSEAGKQKIKLQLSPEAEKYCRADAPVETRRMAAGGALPLAGPELATVLFVLCHDSDAEVKSSARQSLEGLPGSVLAPVLSGPTHAAVLSYLARVHEDDADACERLALNPACNDATIEFLASRPHRRVVDIICNNQQRLLRHPPIVEALGENPLTGRAQIDRILSFLGVERSSAEMPDANERREDWPDPDDLTDEAARAALAAVLGDDVSDFAKSLVEDGEEELTEEDRGNLYKRIGTMSVMQKIKLARMGNKEARGLLIRDKNKIVATAAIRSPRINDSEIAAYAKSRNLCDDVIRVIASNREWTRTYQVKLGLATNPKCSTPTAMKFLNHLQDRDLRQIMKSKDVPSAISTHARRLLTKKGKL